MDLSKHSRSLFLFMLIAFGVLTAGVALAACGEDDEDGGGAAATSTAGNGIDRAFVDDMIPHHESAVKMAEIAQTRGQSEFVKDLADDIIRTQNAEISTLRTVAGNLDDAGVKPKSLGISEQQMGMDHDVSMLQTAKPFDRAFIDMMIPHHQGAIRMARIELAKGAGAEAKQLAKQIIAAQAREIGAMNTHRTGQFGAPSPAGGVPPQDGSSKGGGGHTGEPMGEHGG